MGLAAWLGEWRPGGACWAKLVVGGQCGHRSGAMKKRRLLLRMMWISSWARGARQWRTLALLMRPMGGQYSRRLSSLIIKRSATSWAWDRGLAAKKMAAKKLRVAAVRRAAAHEAMRCKGTRKARARRGTSSITKEGCRGLPRRGKACKVVANKILMGLSLGNKVGAEAMVRLAAAAGTRIVLLQPLDKMCRRRAKRNWIPGKRSVKTAAMVNLAAAAGTRISLLQQLDKMCWRRAKRNRISSKGNVNKRKGSKLQGAGPMAAGSGSNASYTPEGSGALEYGRG